MRDSIDRFFVGFFGIIIGLIISLAIFSIPFNYFWEENDYCIFLGAIWVITILALVSTWLILLLIYLVVNILIMLSELFQ